MPHRQVCGASAVPDMAIVIVHWNVPHLLQQCLHSIALAASRTSISIETIVVDNASSDIETRKVLDDFPGVVPIYLNDNLGYAGGANAGIEQARAGSVLILNPDIEVLGDALDQLWQSLFVSPHVGLVAPLLLNPDGAVQSAGYRFPGLANVLMDFLPVHPRLQESRLNGRVGAGDGVLPVEIDYPLGAAMLVRREALTAIGGFDESYFMYSEEVDLGQRLATAGFTSLLVPAARMIHHGGQSTGQIPDEMYSALWLSRAGYYRRWGNRRQRRAIAQAVRIGTYWDDRKSSPERRLANRKIRDAFDAAADDAE